MAKRIISGLSLAVLFGVMTLGVRALETPTDRLVTSTWPRFSVPIALMDLTRGSGGVEKTNGGLPRIATDSTGRAHAVWGSADQSTPQKPTLVYSRTDWTTRYSNGWSVPRTIVTINLPQGAQQPERFISADIGVDAQDRLHVVYSANLQTPDLPYGDSVWYVTSVDGGATWSTPQLIRQFTLGQTRSLEGFNRVDHDALGVYAPRLVVENRIMGDGSTQVNLHVAWTESFPLQGAEKTYSWMVLSDPGPPEVWDTYTETFYYYLGTAFYATSTLGGGWSVSNVSQQAGQANANQLTYWGDLTQPPPPMMGYDKYAYGVAYPYVRTPQSGPVVPGMAWTIRTDYLPNDIAVDTVIQYTEDFANAVRIESSAATAPDITQLLVLSDAKGDSNSTVRMLWQHPSTLQLLLFERDGAGGEATTQVVAWTERVPSCFEMDPRGSLASWIHVVWGIDSNLYYSRRTRENGSGGTQDTWSTPRRIRSDTLAYPVEAVELVRDAQDNLHLAFGTNLSGASNLFLYSHSWEDNLGVQDALATFGVAPGAAANVATGNTLYQLPLFSTSGRGPSASVALMYNAQDTGPGPISAQGWTTNYHIYLTEAIQTMASGAPGLTAPTIVLTAGDGRVSVYDFRLEFGYYVARPEYGDFSRIYSNLLNQLSDIDAPPGQPIRFMMVSKGGTKYFFLPSGKLARVADTNRNFMDFTYEDNALTTNYQEQVLTRMRDSAPTPRDTLLQYNASNQVTAVTDPAGRMYELTYAGRSISTMRYVSTGDTWEFDYFANTDGATGARKGLMSTVRTPRGADASPKYGYQFSYTPTNRLSKSTDPLTKSLQVDYVDGATPSATFTDRRGNTTAVEFEYNRCLAMKVTDSLGNYVQNTFDQYRSVLTFRDKRGNTTTYAYYASGFFHVMDNVRTVQRPGVANPITYDYTTDRLNRVRSVTDPKGATTEYEYDSFGNLKVVAYPPTDDNPIAEQRYDYDTFGRITSSTEPGQSVSTVYSYGGAGSNGTGLVTSIQRPGLASEQFQYDRMGNATRRTQPEGGETDYDLDGRYRVIEVIGPSGTAGRPNSKTFYDRDGNVVRTDDPKGLQTRNDFDNLGRLTKTTFPDGTTSENLEFDDEGNVLRSKDPNGNQTTFEYDVLNRVSVQDPPLDLAISFNYDANGNLLSTVQGSRTTSNTYDVRNNRVTSNDPLGNQDAATVDDNDSVIASRRYGADGSFRGTFSALDERGRVKRSIEMSSDVSDFSSDPPGRTTRFEYAANSNRTAAIDPSLRRTRYGFDDANRMVTVSDPTDGLTRFSYDDNGNRTSVEVDGPNGGRLITQSTTYNDANQAIEVRDADGRLTSQTFDISGLLIQRAGPVVTSPNSRRIVVDYEYDSRNRLVTQIEHPEVGVDVVARYLYDNNGNRTQVTDPRGKIYQYAYDGQNRLFRITYPAGTSGVTTEEFFYDNFGFLDRRVDPNGRSHEFVNDALGRPLQETHRAAGGSVMDNIVRTYDGRGNLTSVASTITGVAVAYAYNNLGEMLQADWTLSGTFWKRLTYEFDAVGNRSRMTGPDGANIVYSYDNADRLLSVTRNGQTVASWQYDLAGRKRRMLLGNGVGAWYNYDALERLTNLRYELNGRVLASWSSTFDENGNRIGVNMDHRSASWSYSYDGMARLVEEETTGSGPGINPPPDPTTTTTQAPGNRSPQSTAVSAVPQIPVPLSTYTSSWTYDGAGNRLSKTSSMFGNATYEYSDANELTVERPSGGADIVYTYDAAGAMTGKSQSGGPSYTFQTDYANRIRQMTGPDGTFTYLYAPQGERLAKTDVGTGDSEWSCFDGLDAVADYSLPSGSSAYTLTSSYASLMGIDDQVARFVGSVVSTQTPHYYLGDSLGTVHQVLDGAGVRENVNIVDAWGQQISTGQTQGLDDRYTGLAQREMDDESGLQYTRARHYAPSLGRFVQRDPIRRNVPSQHYVYARNNPLRLVDPTGLDTDYSEIAQWSESISREALVNKGYQIVSPARVSGEHYFDIVAIKKVGEGRWSLVVADAKNIAEESVDKTVHSANALFNKKNIDEAVELIRKHPGLSPDDVAHLVGKMRSGAYIRSVMLTGAAEGVTESLAERAGRNFRVFKVVGEGGKWIAKKAVWIIAIGGALSNISEHGLEAGMMESVSDEFLIEEQEALAEALAPSMGQVIGAVLQPGNDLNAEILENEERRLKNAQDPENMPLPGEPGYEGSHGGGGR